MIDQCLAEEAVRAEEGEPRALRTSGIGAAFCSLRSTLKRGDR